VFTFSSKYHRRAIDHVYARRRSVHTLSFSTHLHLELTRWAFTLRMKPFDEIEIDIEETRGAGRNENRGGLRRRVKKA
jgi:hypothetical protein